MAVIGVKNKQEWTVEVTGTKAWGLSAAPSSVALEVKASYKVGGLHYSVGLAHLFLAMPAYECNKLNPGIPVAVFAAGSC